MIKVFALEFYGEAGIAYPKDPVLHKLATEFCEKELAEPVSLPQFQRVWIACETDEEGTPTACLGIIGMVMKVDFALARFISLEAGEALYQRANDHLQDNGLRGAEVFIYVAKAELPEQRCNGWRDILTKMGATTAQRVAVIVK